jgi:hypothetical protein
VTYEWHDHRIHWTAAQPPEGVREHPDQIQRIFTWRVPGLADGKRFAITGFLGYAPERVAAKDDGGASTWLLVVAGLGAAAFVVAAAVVVGARRARRRAPVAP